MNFSRLNLNFRFNFSFIFIIILSSVGCIDAIRSTASTNICESTEDQTVELFLKSISAVRNNLPSECFTILGSLKKECNKAKVIVLEHVCNEIDGMNVIKFAQGSLHCPDSIDKDGDGHGDAGMDTENDFTLEIDLADAGPNGQVCVPNGCTEETYKGYVNKETPNGCTFITLDSFPTIETYTTVDESMKATNTKFDSFRRSGNGSSSLSSLSSSAASAAFCFSSGRVLLSVGIVLATTAMALI